MALAAKLKKAQKLGISFEEGYSPTEEQLDNLIEAKLKIADQEKEEKRIQDAAEARAAEFARKNQIILRDTDGADVDQEDYFFPRTEPEITYDAQGKEISRLLPSKETAPVYFNKVNGMPVDREELNEVFIRHFPRAKGFLFYKKRDSEVYIIIVPLKYAKTISKANESRPGDFQRHALSFIGEGSVNVDSLDIKLKRVAAHSSISTEPIAR
jgi:hypothetical protein